MTLTTNHVTDRVTERHRFRTTRHSVVAIMAMTIALAQSGQSNAERVPSLTAKMTPAAISQQMVQGARRTMMENPARVAGIVRDYSAILGQFPDSRERRVAFAKLYWMAGEGALRQRKFDAARTHLSRAEKLARASNDVQTLADVTTSKASLAEESGSPALAIRGYRAAFRMFQQLDNRRSQAITLHSLGNIYIKAHDAARGEKYIKQAAGIYRDEPVILAAIHTALGNIYTDTDRQSKAHAEYAVAAALARKADMPAFELPIIMNDVRALIKMGRIDEAAATYGRANALIRKGAPATQDSIAINALLAQTHHDDAAAKNLMDQAVALLRGRSPVPGDTNVHEIAYLVYKAIGDERSALRHHELLTSLKDQSVAATLNTQNALLGAQFDYASQDLRIAKLTSDRLQREAQAQHDRMLWSGATTALILAALSVWLTMARRGRKKVEAINLRLGEANTELERALDEVVLRERAEREAIELSEHDALTSLPNRRHLRSNFLRGIVMPDDEPVNVVLMLLDLDRFKPINDIHGHEVGDLILIEVANRLRGLCAGQQAKAVRLGGDEFVIVIEHGASGSPEGFAAQTIATLSMPFDVDDRRLTIGASIGLSHYGRDSTDVSDLMRKADISMYEAKRSGRNTYRLFDEHMDQRLRERAQTETDLRAAVQSEQIHVHYQPIHGFDANRTTSFEALARWTHPLRGAISPEEFIPIAEEIGIISALTDQVLRHACRAAAEWPMDVSVSINLSPMLLADEWIGPRLFGILAEEGLAPHRLIIEITETAVIRDLAVAADVINSFRNSGIKVALDDFGKGHSSLSQLHELAFDSLKLDTSFVRSLDNPDSIKITTAVAGLARAMNLPVTAEGVEDERAAETLQRMGFHSAQGYLYGRPMPAANARELANATSRTDGELDAPGIPSARAA